MAEPFLDGAPADSLRLLLADGGSDPRTAEETAEYSFMILRATSEDAPSCACVLISLTDEDVVVAVPAAYQWDRSIGGDVRISEIFVVCAPDEAAPGSRLVSADLGAPHVI